MESPQRPSSLTASQEMNMDIDIEKQEATGSPDTPDGATTVFGDPTEPSSPVKPGIRRNLTDYLRKVSMSEKFPDPFRGRKNEPPSDAVQRIKRIDGHPEGYPQLAAFLNSDENFTMCRKFGFLHQRVLLYRQDELRDLEDQLIMLDDQDREESPRLLKSRIMDDAKGNSIRKGLIETIDQKLKEYTELVNRIRAISTCRAASARNHRSVRTWLHNTQPISDEEAEFICHKEDLIELADGQEGGWFDGFVEDTLSKVPCRLTRLLFSSAEQRHTTDDAYIHLYSKARIGILVRLVICILVVILLMAPIIVLCMVPTGTPQKIWMIVLFTLFCSVVLSVFTKAKRHEIFAATAAYCAVLTVFFGNILPNAPNH